MNKKVLSTLTAVLLASLGAAPAQAETLTVEPAKDNTIYQESNNSNGKGVHLFAGKTGQNANFQFRRALMQFDLSAIPAGSTIDSASLVLNVSKKPPSDLGTRTFALHRLTKDWGEGSSDAGQFADGDGTAPTTGDATWNFAFYSSDQWSSPGADFIGTASATTNISGTGKYTWAGDGLVADVQEWVDNPDSNFGWILQGPDTNQTARQFDSREATNASNRPKLTITYTPGADQWAGYDILEDGVNVDTNAFLAFVQIEQAPWIYVYNLGKYVYAPESNISASGGWIWVPGGSGGEDGENTWAGYTISEDGVNVDTGSFLAFLQIEQAPWVYVYDLGKYVYAPEVNISASGGWVWIPR